MNRHLKKLLFVLLVALVLLVGFVVHVVVQHKKFHFAASDIGSIRFSEDIEVFVEAGGKKYYLTEKQLNEVAELINDFDNEPPWGWRNQDIVNCAINFRVAENPYIYRIDIESAGNIYVARLQRKSGSDLYYYNAYEAQDLVIKLDEYSNKNCSRKN